LLFGRASTIGWIRLARPGRKVSMVRALYAMVWARRCRDAGGVAVRAVVFDLGGVLEIAPATGWIERWAECGPSGSSTISKPSPNSKRIWATAGARCRQLRPSRGVACDFNIA
jgi:hypothetical protein